MRNLIGISLFFFGSTLFSQTNWPFSLNNNAALEQAFLGSVSNPTNFGKERLSAGLIYLNRTVGSSIKAGGFGLNYRKNHSNIGLQAWQSGTENLNRQQYQLNLGQELSDKFAIGITAGLQRLNQSQNYGSLNQLTGAAFASIKPVENFSASAYWLGFAQSRTESNYQEGGLALNYIASKAASVSVLMKTTQQWDPVLGLSLSYTFRESLSTQITVTDSDEPVLLSLMLGRGSWAPFIQYRQHSKLGAGFSFGVQWSK